MSKSSAEQGKTDAEPNFLLPKRHVVTESNWPEYSAKGFLWWRNATKDQAVSDLHVASACYGSANVYTGEGFDEVERRPIRHRPDMGIYLAPESREHYREVIRRLNSPL